MRNLDITIPPGVVKTDSANQAQNRWVDMDKVRFIDGSPQKWRGWVQLNPIREAPANGWEIDDPITNSGTTTMTVTDQLHGCAVGDTVNLPNAVTIHDIELVGEYTITTVPTDHTFTFEAASTASSTAAAGGADVLYEYYMGAFKGIARGATSWSDSDGSEKFMWGTEQRLYSFVGLDTTNNRTPLRVTGAVSGADPFTVETAGDLDTITVTDTAHGAEIGAYVVVSGATAGVGITPIGEYIVKTSDANTFTIEHFTAASATATGTGAFGGTAVEISYEINPGTTTTVQGVGYGAGQYGDGNYGEPATSGAIETNMRIWYIEGYGNDVLAQYSDGGLYLWEEATDDRAEIVNNAPTSAKAMFVTGERHVFMLGTTTPMRVQWNDIDDITLWAAASTNSAGSVTLASGNKLIGGTHLFNLANLVWSDTSCYIFQFTGSSFVYESRLVGTDCGLIGGLAHKEINGVAYWFSGHHFHMYKGGVLYIPNQDDIRQFVIGELDTDSLDKTVAFHNRRDNELQFHYVSTSSPDAEPDKYVAVSLVDHSWTTGTLGRTAGYKWRDDLQGLLLFGNDSKIYDHELTTSYNANGSAMTSTLTLGRQTLTRGQKWVDIMGVIPDFFAQTGDVDITVNTYDRPQSSSTYDTDSATLTTTSEIEDLRMSGRHYGFVLSQAVVDGNWELGKIALELVTSGGRR